MMLDFIILKQYSSERTFVIRKELAKSFMDSIRGILRGSRNV